jgi:hypothetical protein
MSTSSLDELLFHLQSIKVSQVWEKQYVIQGREAWDQCSVLIIGNCLLIKVIFCKWRGKKKWKREAYAEKKLNVNEQIGGRVRRERGKEVLKNGTYQWTIIRASLTVSGCAAITD